MRSMKLLLLFPVLLAITPAAVLAHGQFPLPLGIALNKDGVDPLVVATFGVLVWLMNRSTEVTLRRKAN